MKEDRHQKRLTGKIFFQTEHENGEEVFFYVLQNTLAHIYLGVDVLAQTVLCPHDPI